MRMESSASSVFASNSSDEDVYIDEMWEGFGEPKGINKRTFLDFHVSWT